MELALDSSKDTLKQKGIDLEIDHSTLGESGTPSIDQTILRKIDACDIFLADITPVCKYNQTLGNGVLVTKEVPNPNVLLEMGYAMSALGVGYVIATAHQGKWIPRDLPFDINHREIYCFTTSIRSFSSTSPLSNIHILSITLPPTVQYYLLLVYLLSLFHSV